MPRHERLKYLIRRQGVMDFVAKPTALLGQFLCHKKARSKAKGKSVQTYPARLMFPLKPNDQPARVAHADTRIQIRQGSKSFTRTKISYILKYNAKR